MAATTAFQSIAGTALTRAAAALTVDAAFRERVLAHPERVALVQEQRRTTYRELHERVRRLCNALQQRGVGRGDRVAVLSENRCEYVEVLLAAAHLGAIVACQNWRLSAAELAHCLNLVAPRVVLVSERHAALLASSNVVVGSVIAFGAEYESLLARAGSTQIAGATSWTPSPSASAELRRARAPA